MNSIAKKWIVCVVVFIIYSICGCALKESVQHDSTAYWPTKGWRTSSPEAQKMDSTILEKMDSDLEKNYPKVRSVILIRNGYIVFEKYYRGDENYPQPIFSATKSIVSALIGIVIDRGYIESIDQKVINYFPEYAEEFEDPRFNEISIRHLLTMSSGFDTSIRGRNSMKKCLEFPITFTPGSEARYNSCTSHLLSGIISNSTKMSTLEFGYKELFEPLGIQEPMWSSGFNGYNKGGTGLEMNLRDMAKIGYLYLNNGVWDGNQLISEDWVKESTKEQIRIKFGQVEPPYGYQWWIVTSPEGYTSFHAVGIGGQYISVYPDFNMVTIVTSDSRDMTPKHQGVVGRYSIDAVID